MTRAPANSPMTDIKYMIHPVVVYCSTTLSGVISLWRTFSFAAESRAPPFEWTIHFGRPVVPDEYPIMKGSRKAVFSKNGCCGLPLRLNSRKVVDLGRVETSAGVLNLGIETKPVNPLTLFISFTISAIFGRRSIFFPLYIAQSSINRY
jgi:hypothetical protein